MTRSFINHLPFVVSPVNLAEASAHDPSVAILDVRTPAEFEAAHIPGSSDVPLAVLPSNRGTTRAAGTVGPGAGAGAGDLLAPGRRLSHQGA